MTEVDITAIINAHREGYLCKPSLDSAKRASELARAQGVSTETIVVLDKADELTKAFVRSQQDPNWRIFAVSFGDLGASRNFGVTKSCGKLVAFLDADDIWGETWLAACVRAARHSSRKAIWHPEINIYFGKSCHVMYHIDMENVDFDLLDLAFCNQWTALACTYRDILLEVPYPLTDLKKGLGYEDWSWNLKTIEKGYLHKVIAGTGHAVRIKTSQPSLLNQTNVSGSVAHPTTAFRVLMDQTRPLEMFPLAGKRTQRRNNLEAAQSKTVNF